MSFSVNFAQATARLSNQALKTAAVEFRAAQEDLIEFDFYAGSSEALSRRGVHRDDEEILCESSGYLHIEHSELLSVSRVRTHRRE